MEKKAGEFPLLWATPFPLPPGQPAQSEQVLPTTPGSAGGCDPDACGAQLRGVLMSPLPMQGRPLLDLFAGGSHTFPPVQTRGQSLSPNAVTPSTAVCPSRLAFSIAWLGTPGNGLCEPPVGSP